MAALAMKPGERIRARLLVRMTQVGCAVDVIDGRREVELLCVRIGILGRHGRHHAFVSRAFLGILSRVLLVTFTFVLIVALAQLALVSASTRAEHLGLGRWSDGRGKGRRTLHLAAAGKPRRSVVDVDPRRAAPVDGRGPARRVSEEHGARRPRGPHRDGARARRRGRRRRDIEPPSARGVAERHGARRVDTVIPF